MTTAKFPTVNGNGESAINLTRQYRESAAAIDAAIDGLVVPHGRDYQTAPDGDYIAMRNEFESMQNKLMMMRDRQKQIALQCLKQS